MTDPREDLIAELMAYGAIDQPTGAAAIRADALIARGWTYVDPDEPHLIKIDDDGWVIQHPLTCRPNLFSCLINQAARGMALSPTSGSGVYEIRLRGNGASALDIGPKVSE